jgi:agmatine deiminase
MAQSIVVIPGFDNACDARARETIPALFPGRRTIAVPSRKILLGGGGIHCLTLQEPPGPRTQLGKDTVG